MPNVPSLSLKIQRQDLIRRMVAMCPRIHEVPRSTFFFLWFADKATLAEMIENDKSEIYLNLIATSMTSPPVCDIPGTTFEDDRLRKYPRTSLSNDTPAERDEYEKRRRDPIKNTSSSII
ncbi:hypothetical protein N7495_000464 [Penicillium taxi]|uniref:uncharacterized protein n=1 Tax=Penicillium taxi TaxID=168475 RepID=UPI0025456B4E|nr:uncharacterized protein N7495_000464 [Penicillium taxi]KAJ5907782.1 hypothetical protein N7495_000464 [Penicillium taxi]